VGVELARAWPSMTERAPRRLDPKLFGLPVEQIRGGFYSDAYFNFAKELKRGRPYRPNDRLQAVTLKGLGAASAPRHADR
jgi:hypothetical protein